jgi:hypothetical protein
MFKFKTESPRAICGGKLMLLPQSRGDGGLGDLKIWVLSTWLVSLEDFPEDEARLTAPPTTLRDKLWRAPSATYLTDVIKTDAFIVGAGNRYVSNRYF